MKTILLATAILFTFLGCRKEEPVDVADFDNYIFKPALCSNGVLDAGEAYIDCGPTCGPCSTVPVSCSNPSMKLVLTQSSNPLISYNFTDADVTRTLTDGVYEVIVESGNDKFIFLFGGKIFEYSNGEGRSSNGYYNVKSHTDNYYVKYYKNGVLHESGLSYNCYFNYKDGKMRVDFCNLYMGSNIVLKGSLSFNQ